MDTIFIDRHGMTPSVNQGRLCIKHESGSINTNVLLRQM